MAGRLQAALEQRASHVDRVLMDADSQVAATKAAVWAGIQELERRAAQRGGAAAPREAVVPAVPAGSDASSAAAAHAAHTHAPLDPAFVAAFQGPLRLAQGRAAAQPHGCHSTECAICMAEARWGEPPDAAPSRGASGKTVALLSCSHVLHAACIGSWEKFQAGDATCPVCRAAYTRCDLNAEALRQLR